MSNKKSLGMIDGRFDFLPFGLMSGEIELKSQIPGVEKLKLNMDQLSFFSDFTSLYDLRITALSARNGLARSSRVHNIGAPSVC